MAELDYDKIQLIVENNMRDAGFQGDFENGWKQTIVIDNKSYVQQFNLQGLRDIIAKSIVDAMSNSQATGSISTGNIQGTPAVVKDLSSINVTLNSLLPSQKAARETDDTRVNITSDPQFIAWMNLVNAFISAATSASQLPAASAAYTVGVAAIGGVPSKVDGKISSGSATVKIGD